MQCKKQRRPLHGRFLFKKNSETKHIVLIAKTEYFEEVLTSLGYIFKNFTALSKQKTLH